MSSNYIRYQRGGGDFLVPPNEQIHQTQARNKASPLLCIKRKVSSKTLPVSSRVQRPACRRLHRAAPPAHSVRQKQGQDGGKRTPLCVYRWMTTTSYFVISYKKKKKTKSVYLGVRCFGKVCEQEKVKLCVFICMFYLSRAVSPCLLTTLSTEE